MKAINIPLSKTYILLLTIITLSILLIMLSHNADELVNKNKYRHPKSDNLSYNLTISSYPTNKIEPNQGIPKTDITKIKSTAKIESITPTTYRRIDEANPKPDIATSNSTISTKPVGLSAPIQKRRLPQAILIGVCKAGTRAIVEMMEMHSKFVAPKADEMHFFDNKYNRGLKWYRRQMPYSYEDQITFEKTPGYFRISNLVIPKRIHKMNSTIRLILIVRDPVVRSISHFVQRQKTHHDDKLDFEEIALRSDGKVNQMHIIISDSLYEQAFKLYLEVFSPEQILVIDGDQLIKNPLPIIKKVEKFLNLQPEITKENFYFDQKKGFYCMKYNGIKECMSKHKGRKHPKVNERVLKKLGQFFNHYNQRFYSLIGQDFGWPTY